MSAVEIFRDPTGQTVRTIVRDGEPLFSVPDLCRGLQHSKPSVAIQMVDEDDRVKVDTRYTDIPNVNPVNPDMWFVTESGFFTLALASQAPGARAFRRWITHEVLPAIRKTGSYGIVPQHQLPQTFAQALELAAKQARELEAANTALAVAEPKAEAWDVLASTQGDYSARDAANILNRDPNIKTGQNRLIGLLRDFGMTDRLGRPYAKHAGHLRLRATSYADPWTGEEKAKTQIRVTPDGVRYLHKKLGGIRQPAFAELVRGVAS